jgi:hypothetical protein
MTEKQIKDIARIISTVSSNSGSGQLIGALSIYFEDEFQFDAQDFRELATGMSKKKLTELEWAYTKTEDKDKNDAITKSNIRMAYESGFGVPNDEWEQQRCMLNNGED